MRRESSPPRDGWPARVEKLGLLYHTNADGSAYWDESACYVLSPAEAARIEAAARELHGMFLHACGTVIEHRQLASLGIPETLHPGIERSWEKDEWELYGRFDFALAPDGTPKLLEYNADTPTGLLEASLVQWFWKEEVRPGADQFNSLHEALVARWGKLAARGQLRRDRLLHFASVAGHREDRMTAAYLAETAERAGFDTTHLSVDRIGHNARRGCFVDPDEREIAQLFKLYPWEWMGTEAFGTFLPAAAWRVVEPPWKVVCSGKGLLLVLQELYPGHPNLLPVSLKPDAFPRSVRKPFWGREGRAVTLLRDGSSVAESGGEAADDRFLYQQYAPLFTDGNGSGHAQLGIWMIGPEACGLGIREGDGPILTNTSRFVPHVLL